MLAISRMRLLPILLLFSIVACNGKVETSATTPPTTSTAPPTSTYQSSVAPPPEHLVSSQSGSVIANPEIMTVTWRDEPLDADLESFDRWFVTSDTWTSTLAEYGVGPGTYGGHVHIDAPFPASLHDTEITDLLTSAGIAAKSNRVVLIYAPSSTTVFDGDRMACDPLTGFHGVMANASNAYYAVIPRCAAPELASALEDTTRGSSVVVMDTVTDPDWSKPAYLSFDGPFPGEIGWNCLGQRATVDGHTIGLVWSNAAAQAGARPCVPAPPGPMFGVFAPDPEVTLAAGQRVDIPLKAFATGSYPEFGVKAYCVDPAFTVTLSAATAKDGDSLTLTVSGPGGMPEIELVATGSDYQTVHSVDINPE